MWNYTENWKTASKVDTRLINKLSYIIQTIDKKFKKIYASKRPTFEPYNGGSLCSVLKIIITSQLSMRQSLKAVINQQSMKQ